MKKYILTLLVSVLFFQAFGGVGEPTFNHSKWHELVQKHVSNSGNVNYDGFQKDRAKLKEYLNELNNNVPNTNWSKNAIMAYWINAYNAYTVELILRNYPLKSILDINEGKAWDLEFINLGNKKYSLNNIEHDILRKRFKEPRIHFAVNCASISCPKLYNSAFSEVDLEKQLEKLTKEFVNENSKNSISPNSIQISKLFDWYKEDFTREGSVIEYLNKYSTTKINTDAKLNYKEYNWNLNN